MGMHLEPRSAALPVILTMVVLAGLTWRVACFKQVRMQITIPEAAGQPPVLRRDHDYHVVGLVEDGGNPYRRLKSLNFSAFRMEHGRWTSFQYRLINQRYDDELNHYEATIRFDNYFQAPPPGPAFLELQGADASGGGHYRDHDEIPGSVIEVWVE
jgi:hypothetical protein